MFLFFAITILHIQITYLKIRDTFWELLCLNVCVLNKTFLLGTSWKTLKDPQGSLDPTLEPLFLSNHVALHILHQVQDQHVCFHVVCCHGNLPAVCRSTTGSPNIISWLLRVSRLTLCVEEDEEEGGGGANIRHAAAARVSPCFSYVWGKVSQSR